LREEGAVGREPVGRSVYGTFETPTGAADAVHWRKSEVTGASSTGAFDPERSFKSRFDARIYLNSGGESWAAPVSLFFGE
jgi:hypothetical protein